MRDARRRAWWYVGGWLVIQLTATSLPGRALPGNLGHPVDYVGHFGMYTVLGLLVARAAVLSGFASSRALVLWSVLVAVAALDEFHQLVIPDRSASIADWLCDSAGAGAGLWTWFVASRRWTRWLR